MSKQKNYTFKYYKQLVIWNNEDVPFGEESAKQVIKDRLNAEGYLVKNVCAKMLWVATCNAASAKRDPRDVRKKLQESVDNSKNDSLFPIKRIKGLNNKYD